VRWDGHARNVRAARSRGNLGNIEMKDHQEQPLDFTFTTRTGGVRATSSFTEAFSTGDPRKECILCITAHDDDPILGAALFIAAAGQLDIPVHILITTDGSMGYLLPGHDHGNISAIRREETYAGYGVLGVPRELIVFLGYPDADLAPHLGRRKARNPADPQIAGFSGLLTAYVHHIRRLRPTRVLLHTINDPHPDHKIVYEQGLWSVFMAASPLWPELGAPCEPPVTQEYLVYSDFTGDPDWQIRSERGAELRLEAVRKFASQGSIHGLEQELERTGPYEWHQEIKPKKAERARLRKLFEG